MSQTDLFQLAFESFTNFVIVDASENVFYINDMYARLLGHRKEELIGKPVVDVIPGTLMPEVVRTGKAQTGDMMTLFDHEAGKTVSVICNRIPLLKNGKILGAAAFTTFDNIENIQELQKMLDLAQKENHRYKEELQILRAKDTPLDRIIGQNAAIVELKHLISDFAKSNLSVLLTGETGVGKEVFASALHELSTRNQGPFIKVNCAAIPKDLLESELFGYEEGSFTGAKKHGKPGRFELADGGTLLLDEIGEMPLALQAKLLRVLQEKEIDRIGGTAPIKINVRILCSTNKDIPSLIRRGLFREDLYYRINTIEMRIPPLRDRKDDIPALSIFLINKINAETGGSTQGISPEALALFQSYNWPGNVRELEHILERLCFQCQGKIIAEEDCVFLKERITQPEIVQPKAVVPDRSFVPIPDYSLKESRAAVEIESIRKALEQTHWNKAKAAELLGIDRSSLYYKMKKYRID